MSFGPDSSWESDAFTNALSAWTDDGYEFQFGYAQFLHMIRCHNRQREKEPEVARERMEIHFSSGVVVVLGDDLRLVAKALRQGHLCHIRRGGEQIGQPIPELGAKLPGVRIRSVTVKLTETP